MTREIFPILEAKGWKLLRQIPAANQLGDLRFYRKQDNQGQLIPGAPGLLIINPADDKRPVLVFQEIDQLPE